MCAALAAGAVLRLLGAARGATGRSVQEHTRGSLEPSEAAGRQPSGAASEDGGRRPGHWPSVDPSTAWARLAAVVAFLGRRSVIIAQFPWKGLLRGAPERGLNGLGIPSAFFVLTSLTLVVCDSFFLFGRISI